MAEESKKISFGFAKSIKKPALVKQISQEKKKIDYIECFDEKTIKVIGEEDKKETPLIIPLLGSKTWHDRIINKIDADIFETKNKNENDIQAVKIKEEPEEEIPNGDTISINKDISNVQIKTEPDEKKNEILTLEEQAAKEIIEDLKSEEKEDKLDNLTLPLKEEENLRGMEESTLEDYEKIPIDAFGFAMLRGMGWEPGKGIGKNEKIVANVVPELRPKGMGLGADKMALQKQNGKAQKEEKELRMEKGTFIKVIAGKQSHAYGQIEGFDEDVGRLIVKMALSGNIVSINECTVQAVTKEEFLKNSKVLNVAKYEEFKSKESASKRRSMDKLSEFSHSDNDSDIKKKKRKYREDDSYKSKKSSKKSKSQRRDSSDSDNKRSTKRKHSSNDKTKKSKKSKKHKKENKVSKYFESPDRRKSRNHRSRSSSRR